MAKKIDRSYQDKIVDILGRMKEERGKSSTEGNYSTLIVIPTGGGKTVIGLKYVKEHAISKGDKVLWLTHRRQLLAQTLSLIYIQDEQRDLEIEEFARDNSISSDYLKQLITEYSFSGILDNAKIKQELRGSLGLKQLRELVTKVMQFVIENCDKYQIQR